MLNPPITRVKLPAATEKMMKAWRNGFLDMPRDYIDFHRKLAERRLEVLKATHRFRVLDVTMRGAGWFDGMEELNAIVETVQGKLVRLVWCDSNQDFMRKLEAGQCSCHDDDLR